MCNNSERYPGMFEVPVYDLNAMGGDFSMDPDAGTNLNLYSLLKANFDAAYNGNRAPLPIYVHTPWFAENNNQALLTKFVGERGSDGVAGRCQGGGDGMGCVCWCMHQLLWLPPRLTSPSLPPSLPPPPHRRLRAGPTRRLLCDHAPDAGLDAEPHCRGGHHACCAGLRQRGWRRSQSRRGHRRLGLPLPRPTAGGCRAGQRPCPGSRGRRSFHCRAHACYR